jgi:hypothetical protein
MTSFLIDPYRFGVASTLLLDLYPGAAAAYSLRQLRTGVTSVVRVRRSSDNTEADFTAAEVTDGTLTSWVGAGNNGLVRTWYDQSGNNRHATQTASINQPRLVIAGSLVQTNSRPAVDFDGSDDRMDVPTIAFNMNAITVNIVCKADTSNGLFAFASPDNNRMYVPFVSSGNYSVGYNDSATKFAFGGTAMTSQYLVQLAAGSSTVNAWRNNAASASATPSSAPEAGNSISIGSYKRDSLTGNFWDGTIQEIIFYTSDQTSSRAGIASNINGHYTIY